MLANHERTVAEEAAASVLALTAAQGNKSLPSLIGYLAFEAPRIDALPLMFLRSGQGNSVSDAHTFARAKRLAIAGRMLVARVRWLDEMLDAPKLLGTLEEVHRLSAAVHKKAVDDFTACIVEPDDVASFIGTLAHLEARYATSLAIDGACCRGYASSHTAVQVNFESYAEQAVARAMIVSAPVEAQMLVTKASNEEQQRVRECLRSLAVAWQLYDDVLDLEEDYRDGRISWLVSETLRSFPGDNHLPGLDAFYEAALVGGYLQNALRQSRTFYQKAECAAGDMFPEVANVVRSEIQKTTQLNVDFAEISLSASH